MMKASRTSTVFAIALLVLWSSACLAEERGTAKLDPAAWGSDHVGKPMPDYVTGDECLFCHRDIGPTWPHNRHTSTLRPSQPSAALTALETLDAGKAKQVKYLMGRKRITRFLKRSTEYGKLDLLTAACAAPELAGVERKLNNDCEWDSKTFADRCAGCHTTAVDTETRAFSAISIDCVACHGSVDLAHTKDTKVVLLSKANQPPREVISICGQCHLRGGKSKSTALPYPNTFVPGDNLFRDFAVDLSREAISQLTPMDRHVFENARQVVVLGNDAATCLSCHDVHGASSEKHQELAASASCLTCHIEGSDHSELNKSFIESRGPKAHSRICDY